MQHSSLSKFKLKFFTAICVCLSLIFLSSCLKQQRQFVQSNTQTKTQAQQSAKRLNINTATQEELETLPSIGKEMAARIIQHRNRYGRFQRAEHLLLVRGMSDKKYRALKDLIEVNW